MLNPGAATAPRDWELKLRELKLSVVNLESPLHRRRRLRARNASTLMALLCCRSAAVRLEKDCDELDTVLHGNWRPEESGEKTPCATTIFPSAFVTGSACSDLSNSTRPLACLT